MKTDEEIIKELNNNAKERLENISDLNEEIDIESIPFDEEDLPEELRTPEEKKSTYYAIIPAKIRYADISSSSKLLYGEITALCNQKGYCWASNKYFAELYKVSNRSISNWIRELKEKDFIYYKIFDNYKREIHLTDKSKLSINLEEG